MRLNVRTWRQKQVNAQEQREIKAESEDQMEKRGATGGNVDGVCPDESSCLAKFQHR